MTVISKEKYTYGSVSHFNSRVFIQDYSDPDTGDDVTARVEVQVDKDGVYIEAQSCSVDGFKECISIPTHDIAVEVAEYILNEYGQGPTPQPTYNKTEILDRLNFIETYTFDPIFKRTIDEIRSFIN